MSDHPHRRPTDETINQIRFQMVERLERARREKEEEAFQTPHLLRSAGDLMLYTARRMREEFPRDASYQTRAAELDEWGQTVQQWIREMGTG